MAPSTVDACCVTPRTSTGPRQWRRADPQSESRQSHHPEAGHCCPDRTNGEHPPEPPTPGTAFGSPSGPKSVLRCVADTPPPQVLDQRPPTNGSAPRNALGAHGSWIGWGSPTALACRPAVATIGGALDRHDPRVSPTLRWVHRFWPNSRDGLQHQPLPQDH